MQSEQMYFSFPAAEFAVRPVLQFKRSDISGIDFAYITAQESMYSWLRRLALGKVQSNFEVALL